jgi:DNA-binding NarL/FixJ family response regulator
VIRVLVVDDHAWVRDSLVALLNGTDGIGVVGECADGAEVLQAAADLQPDVVVMDIEMPRVSGLTATRRLVAAMPDVQVILIGARPAHEDEVKAAGAAGLVVKGTPPQALVDAIHAVAAGRKALVDRSAG